MGDSSQKKQIAHVMISMGNSSTENFCDFLHGELIACPTINPPCKTKVSSIKPAFTPKNSYLFGATLTLCR